MRVFWWICYILRLKFFSAGFFSGKNLGVSGEKLAKYYVLSQGKTLLAFDYRSRWGQIDLVFSDKDQVVFAEVKTRRVDREQDFMTLSAKQRKRILQSSVFFIERHSLQHKQPRFDLIYICCRSSKWFLHHYPNYFSHF